MRIQDDSRTWANAAQDKYVDYQRVLADYEADGNPFKADIALRLRERSLAEMTPHLLAEIERLRAEVDQALDAHGRTVDGVMAAGWQRVADQTTAVDLLKYAFHLRQHGERAPGGDETWDEFDRRIEDFLRSLISADQQRTNDRPYAEQAGGDER